jgi:Ser-tRNA(Ala) deacylase AlaX
MEKILRQGTSKTPYILADPDQGLIEIKGRSNPENSAEFYKPVVEWLDEYVEFHKGEVTLVIDLEHFNTSSSKCIMDIMKRLKKIYTANRAVNISWYYEEDDEEMLEAAETYEAMTNLDIEKISKPINERDFS